jgi:hypothetical protein
MRTVFLILLVACANSQSSPDRDSNEAAATSASIQPMERADRIDLQNSLKEDFMPFDHICPGGEPPHCVRCISGACSEACFGGLFCDTGSTGHGCGFDESCRP